MPIEIQNMKPVIAVAPVSLNNASATAIEVDAGDYTNAVFDLTVGATDGAISVYKIQSATTSGGSFSDVSGATLSTLPGATDDNKVYRINVDLTDRSIGRFLQVVLTEDNTGTGIYGVNAYLSNASGNSPDSASGRGLAAEAFA